MNSIQLVNKLDPSKGLCYFCKEYKDLKNMVRLHSTNRDSSDILAGKFPRVYNILECKECECAFRKAISTRIPYE